MLTKFWYTTRVVEHCWLLSIIIQLHIQEEPKPQQHRCNNLKYHKDKTVPMHVTKVYVGRGSIIPLILILGNVWRFTAGQSSPVALCIYGWVVPTVRLDVSERFFFASFVNRPKFPQLFRPHPSHYANWGTKFLEYGLGTKFTQCWYFLQQLTVVQSNRLTNVSICPTYTILSLVSKCIVSLAYCMYNFFNMTGPFCTRVSSICPSLKERKIDWVFSSIQTWYAKPTLIG
jgi:hypothetical protein